MGQRIEVPGQGIVEFPDNMTDDQIVAAIKGLSAQAGPAQPDLGPAIAAAGDQGIDVPRNNRGQATDLEGNVIAEPQGRSPSLSGAQGRGFKARAEDVLTRTADALSFGTLPKLSAKIGELQGKGTYDELIAKRRREVEEAGERLGTGGKVASDVLGGVLTGSALARGGLSLVGRLAPNASLAQKVLAGAVEGGIYGAAQGAGHTEGEFGDYVGNAAKEGALGLLTGGTVPAVAGGVQRAWTPFPANPQRAPLIEALDEAGVRTSAGQRTANPTLRTYEDTIGKLPFGRNPAAGQMEDLTAAAMRRSGLEPQGGRLATPDILQDGYRRIGGGIREIQDRYPIRVDDRMLNDLVRVESEIMPVVSEGRHGALRHFINRMSGSQELTPEMAQATRSQLNRAIRAQNGFNGDKEYQSALIALKETLDEGLTRSIASTSNHGDVNALAALRQQYANLNTLTDAIASSGKSGAEGVLTPSALAASLARSVGKSGYAQGRGDLNDLARAGTILQAPPDSFTNTRSSLMDMFRLAGAIPGRALGTSRPAQAYWGNQQWTEPVAPGLLAPAAAGAVAGSGPADRIMEGLLRP